MNLYQIKSEKELRYSDISEMTHLSMKTVLEIFTSQAALNKATANTVLSICDALEIDITSIFDMASIKKEVNERIDDFYRIYPPKEESIQKIYSRNYHLVHKWKERKFITEAESDALCNKLLWLYNSYSVNSAELDDYSKTQKFSFLCKVEMLDLYKKIFFKNGEQSAHFKALLFLHDNISIELLAHVIQTSKGILYNYRNGTRVISSINIIRAIKLSVCLNTDVKYLINYKNL